MLNFYSALDRLLPKKKKSHKKLGALVLTIITTPYILYKVSLSIMTFKSITRN